MKIPNRKGAIHTGASVRYYLPDGRLVYYKITQEALAGETVPHEVLESWFPQYRITIKSG
jgi:hypothetical protein